MKEIKYTLIRKHIKNINIRIKCSGEIVVSAPFLCTKNSIEKVLESKKFWILSKQQEVLTRPQKPQYNSQDISFLYERIDRLLPKWEKITGLQCSVWKLRNMKSRWGSCNIRTREIHFSTMLADKSEECLESVIVHELAHIKVPNHSKNFYDLIFRYMPDYKERNKELKRR